MANSSDLAEAVRLIDRQVLAPTAKFAIADEGFPDEASALATRDGFLNLALALLRLVAAADAGHGWEEGGRYARDDGIKGAMHQIPSAGSVWLVGAYLFRDHEAFVAHLKLFVGPELASSLTNDPAFGEPPLSRVTYPISTS